MTKIMTTVGENMEALECRADNPDTAFRAGQREARKYTAMGHPCECVGVLSYQDVLHGTEETDCLLPVGGGMAKRVTREVHGTFMHTYYRPVISPALPVEE